jgi:pimeloyl-ACP methyl ester carboxylesterase
MKIPHHNFGGNSNGRLLHFAHPNAYTPACFQQLINPLLPYYHVRSVIHRPLWPGAKLADVSSWEMMADDMIQFFDEQGMANMIGVGHSMGAVMTMLAAVKRPSLFSHLILIEPVFLPPQVVELSRSHPETFEQIPIIKNARKRRYQWPNRQAAFDHFRGKKAFCYWPDQSLWDYVNYGMREDGDEVTLTYTREWEAHCYTLAAHSGWEVFPQVQQPLLVIRGAESDALWPESWALLQQLQPQAQFKQFEDAGHMIVMERPSLMADLILDFVQTTP